MLLLSLQLLKILKKGKNKEKRNSLTANILISYILDNLEIQKKLLLTRKPKHL